MQGDLVACQKHPPLPLGDRRGHFIYLFVCFNKKLDSTLLSVALAVHLLVHFHKTQSCFNEKAGGRLENSAEDAKSQLCICMK